MKNFNYKKYLAEGKLFEEGLIWKIDGESADIRDAGPEYRAEVESQIKAIHPNISDEDLEEVIDTANDMFYKNAREANKSDFGSGDKSLSSEDFVEMAKEIYEDDFLNEADAIPTSPGKSEIDDDGKRNISVMSNAERKMALRNVIDVLGKQYPELNIDDKLDFVSIHAKDFFSGDVDPYSEEEIKNEYEEYSTLNNIGF